MPQRPPGLATLRTDAATAPGLIPCLLLSHGRPMLPSEEGPVPALRKDGKPPDLFELLDAIRARYPLLYLVDLDGIERNRPQLDYLSEIARDIDLWVDAGVPTGDQAIDILVTGARKAVLSSAYLDSERELVRAWRLSPDLLVNLEVRDRLVVGQEPGWTAIAPEMVAQKVRELGPQEIVASYRAEPVNWGQVELLARAGPTWVAGSFAKSEVGRLAASGARGGVFHLAQETTLLEPPAAASSPPGMSITKPERTRPRRRDDEA
jgi:histidine biosynthesis protein